MLHEESVQWLHIGISEARHEGLSVLPGAQAKNGTVPRLGPKTSRQGRSSCNLVPWISISLRTVRIGEGHDEGELYEHAAELGVKEAQGSLGFMHANGKDVEKDTAKALRHYEAAAMSGHVVARYNLGCEEGKARNYDLALQHFLISATLGHENSLSNVKVLFMKGLATKADYAAALRGYQNAVEEMSSPDRDEARALGVDTIKKM